MAFLFGAVLLACARPLQGQIGLGAIVLSVTHLDGAVAAGAALELTADGSLATTHSVVIDEAAPVAALTLPVGSYHLRARLAGFRPAQWTFYNLPGGSVNVTVRMAPDGGTTESRIEASDRLGVAHQTVFEPGHLGVLPGSRTLWSLLDTAHPFLISDRIDNGGLWSAEPSLLAGHGSPWSQTTFRLDGLDVTDPGGRGTPLLYPDLDILEAVQVDSARLPADAGGPGPLIVMVPRRPGDAWTGTAQAFVTPRSLQRARSSAGSPVSVARFDSWTDGGVVVSGPVAGPRLGILASTRVTRARRVERAEPTLLKGDVRSFYGHIHASPSPGDGIRVVTAVNDMTRPFSGRARFEDRNLDERVRATVLHSAWEHAAGAGVWSVGGGYQRFTTDPGVDATAPGGTIERLRDGPPLALTEPAQSVRQRWDVAASWAPPLRRWLGREHVMRAGTTIGGASVANVPVAQPPFAELVNGRPARVWDVASRGPESRWTALAASGFASDRISLLSGLTVDAGVRVAYDRGSADGASNSIGWADVSPRLSVRWRPGSDSRFGITTGYSWYQHRLPLDYFAVGDPAGSTGYVYRWDDANGDRRYTGAELTQVEAVGSCCAGAQPNTIDPDLRRPSTREFLIGVEHAIGSWRWRITGMDRRERDLVALVNVGVTAADYSVSYVLDPGVDIAGGAGFDPLPIYNRSVASFGRDRYTLTNPDSEPSRYQGVEIAIEKELSPMWHVRFGGTAYRSEGIGANRGFRSDENDQGVLGEAFRTPNAQTSAYGRLFFDRAYAIKVSGAYKAPGDVRVGVAARYQDGQPFSRVVLAEGLNQGLEAVHAYPRGGQRFTYTLTVDARVDKELWRGRQKLGLVVEAFNLLDTAKEVEEDVVTGPLFRTVTAVQPPRAIRLGLRLTF